MLAVALYVVVAAQLSACQKEAGNDGEAQDAGVKDSGSARASVEKVTGIAASAAPRSKRQSLIQLIAAPDRFRGAEVRVSGYYTPDGEPPDGILFFDKESARIGLLQNAVHVRFGRCRYVSDSRNMNELEGRDMSEGYAVIQGLFEPSLLDDAWPYAGEICGVTLANHLPEPSERSGRPAVSPDGGRQ